jgi:hypothetical protein
MADVTGENNTQTTVEDLSRKIDNERRDRELALIAQEHRLIPALGNIVKAWSHPDNETRAELWPKAVQALAWCLIPRTITTSVSIVAIASLILTWWQTNILSEQTKYLKLQNALMETQLRTDSMENSNEIFRILRTEMGEPGGEQELCGNRKTLCWTDSGNFVPSESTIARITSLTHSLTPYKYIIADSNPCIAEAFSGIGVSLVNTHLSDAEKYASQESEASTLKALSRVKRSASKLLDYHAKHSFSDAFFGALKSSIFSNSEQDTSDNKNHLSCEPNSPERGRLLVGLSAEKIDIKTLQDKGANFQNSNIQGAISANKLKGLRLRNSDLSEAVIVGELIDVELTGVTLGAATFRDAKVISPIINGANINLALTRSESEEARQTFKAINGGNITGFNAFFFGAPRSNAADRELCRLTGMTSNSTDSPFKDYAVITETRLLPTGYYNSLSTLAIKRFDNPELIIEGEDRLGNFRVTYYPLDKCNAVGSSTDVASFK